MNGGSIHVEFHLVASQPSSYIMLLHIQLPEELDIKSTTHLNGGNIYITSTTPPSVVKMYQQQFQKDLSLFLKLRFKELSPGGQMLMTLLGRKNKDAFHGNLNHVYGLLGQAMQSLVAEVHEHIYYV
jgi:hypothetical protein